MPVVKLPDGMVVKFPDNMPEAQINAEIERHLMAQPGSLETMSNAATDVGTFGLNKPINAAGLAAIDYLGGKGNYGDLFDKAMQWQDQRSAAGAELNPVSDVAGKALGFTGSMGAFTPAKAVPVVGGVMRNVGRSVRNNAIVGAGLSEANAVANTPGGAQEKLSAAYPAGAGGAVLGATLPLAAQGVVSAAKKAASPVINAFMKTPEEKATAKIAKRFAQDNVTPDQAQEALANLGPDATLADVGGTNVQKLTRTIFNTPGKAANNAANFLMGRAKQMGSNVQDAVKAAFNTNAEYNDTIANLQQAKIDQAAPLYKQAFAANPMIKSPKLDRLLQTDAGKDALEYARHRMNNKLSLMGTPDPDLAEQAQLVGTYQPGGIAQGFKLETHDFIKQGFDDAIRAGRPKVANGTMKAGELSDIIKQKNAYLDELDRLDATAAAGPNSTKPEGGAYKQARAAWSGPSQSADALEMGRNFMKEDAQITANDITALEPGDRHFFNIGAARAIGDEAKANPANTVKKVLNNDLYKEKLQAALPADDYYDFLTSMQNEATKQSTKGAVFNNSTTASQLKDMAEEGGSGGLPMGMNVGNIIDASQGDWKGAAFQGAKHLYNKVTAPSPAVSDQMGQMLLNPQNNTSALQSLQGFGATPRPQFNVSPQLNPFGFQAAALSYGQ